jgi:hypothetical protein
MIRRGPACGPTSLALLLLTVLSGITIQGPLLERLIAAPSFTAQLANLPRP